MLFGMFVLDWNLECGQPDGWSRRLGHWACDDFGLTFAILASCGRKLEVFGLLVRTLCDRCRRAGDFLSGHRGRRSRFSLVQHLPRTIFMGDVGSLSLGGALGILAILTKNEILLVLVGGIFVLEAISVILQVGSYKMTGKRIFAMAPIHHHYEKKGWSEPKIIVRFWIISILLALVALTTLKVRWHCVDNPYWSWEWGAVASQRPSTRCLRAHMYVRPISTRMRQIPGAQHTYGKHIESEFTKADLIIVSPGIPASAPHLDLARKAGVRVVSELGFAAELIQQRGIPIIAVTGTNGKSSGDLVHRPAAGIGGAPRFCG